MCVCKLVEVNETKWRAQVNILLHPLSDYEVLQTSTLHFFSGTNTARAAGNRKVQ